jgi:hypothetical protein
MERNPLNKKISIPDLPRDPHVWATPDADMLYNDHLIDPLQDDKLREEWLLNETNSNPLISTDKDKKDIKESLYGAKLGSAAFKFTHRKHSHADNERQDVDEDEEQDVGEDDK